MFRKSIMMAFFASTLLIAGCNTVDGVGEDLQSASQETKEEINK